MISNAVIESASIECSESTRGMLNLVVCCMLDTGFGGVFEGHHALYLPPYYKNHQPQSLLGHITHLWMQAAGVTKFEELKGKIVRIEHDGSNTTPCRVGHAIDNDKWFSTDEECRKAHVVADVEVASEND